MAGSKPGERRGGRQKGSLNKATADVKLAAAEYSPMALATLADIARSGESEQARVSAANAILDRAHGKPGQAHEVKGEVKHTHESGALEKLASAIDRLALRQS